MADNDQNNDEYQFTEIDSLENESIDDPDFSSDVMSPPPPAPERVIEGTNVKRNALILLGTLAFLMLMYKFIGGMLSRKSAPIQASIHQSQPVAEAPSQSQTSIIPQEPIVTQPAQPVVQENNSVVPEKIASIEASQQSVQSEVNSMTQQVVNVNNNINTLNEQMIKMNRMLDELTTQMARQTEELNVLRERVKSKLMKRRIHHKHAHAHQPVYYINAIIPGRAWLIGSNGSTLTVREGTKIAGYGVVRLIDSLEGRILTSSGRVIRFDQENS